MKKLFVLLTALFTLAQVNAQEKNVIRIATDNTDLILQVAPNGRLYQAYLGDKLLNEKNINNFSPYVKGGSDLAAYPPRGWEVYPGSRRPRIIFEPAVAITHNDGNKHDSPLCMLPKKAVAGGTRRQSFRLKDDQYRWKSRCITSLIRKKTSSRRGVKSNMLKKKPVTIWRYASTMLYFSGNEYYLTEFSSDWAKRSTK